MSKEQRDRKVQPHLEAFAEDGFGVSVQLARLPSCAPRVFADGASVDRSLRGWVKDRCPSSTSAIACAFSQTARILISLRDPAGVSRKNRPRRGTLGSERTHPRLSIRFKLRLNVDFSRSSSRVTSLGRARPPTAIAARRLSWVILMPWSAK